MHVWTELSDLDFYTQLLLYYFLLFGTPILTEKNLTHIDPYNPRCSGLSIIPFLFPPYSFTRGWQFISIFRLPFLFLGGRKGTKVSLLPSDLGYLAMHVTTIITAVPHSLPPLLHLLLPLVGVLLPCMTQYILTKGTFGQAVSTFCIPQKWDIKIIVFCDMKVKAVQRFLNFHSYTLTISLSFLLWNRSWYAHDKCLLNNI